MPDNPSARQPEPRTRPSLPQSFGHAFAGLGSVLRSERNARIHLVAAMLIVALAAWLGLSATEWAILIIAIALVFAGEMLNTVVEVVVDMITLHHDARAKRAKDIAAGAVLVGALAAAIIGLIIMGPHLIARFGWF